MKDIKNLSLKKINKKNKSFNVKTLGCNCGGVRRDTNYGARVNGF